MPITRCIVRGCPSVKGPDMQMFRLPHNDTTRMLWMKHLLPLYPGLKSFTKNQLIDKPVCMRHFEAKYIEGKKRSADAVPTLFTKEEIESGIPTQPIPYREAKQMLNEHSYSYMRPRVDHNYCKGPDLENTGFAEDHDDGATNADWLDAADDDPLLPVHGITIDYDNSNEFTRRRVQKFNKIQRYLDEFIKEIQDDIVCPPPEDITAQKGKFADELETYNFSSKVIHTNIQVKPYDPMKHLMHSEKAYAAITYCLLRQQELFEDSIRDFLTWATNSVIDYGSLKEKVSEVFENGEFVKISFKMLQLVCKYREKNVEMRKEGIVNQTLEPEIKESLSNIRHTSTHLFEAKALMSALSSVESIQRLFVPKKLTQTAKHKHDRGIQVNILPQKSHKHDRCIQVHILPQKSHKHVQVKPKKARKAGKAVQVNSNELEGIATAKKVKKKDTGSQTSEKDRLLGETMLYRENLPLREKPDNVTVDESPLNHCQKIQYVVKIKRKPHSEGAPMRRSSDSLKSNIQAGPENTNHPHSQHIQSDYNSIAVESETQDQDFHHGPKKKRKSTKRAPDPSMPVLWDACQNLLSLGGSNMNETETEKVHSTLERKNVTPKRPRPHFGKKRRPKIPEALKEQASPMQSVGTSPMQSTSDSSHLQGKSVSQLHVCDSPYLLGGCKHTYDPQAESVPPSSIRRGQKSQSSAYLDPSRSEHLRNPLSQPGRSNYDTEVPGNPNYQDPSVVELAQSPVTAETNQGSSNTMLLLTYDNLLSRWA